MTTDELNEYTPDELREHFNWYITLKKWKQKL